MPLQTEMRQQRRRLQTVAREDDNFADISLRQRKQHRPRRAASANNNSGLARQWQIGNRPVKSGGVGVGPNQCALSVAKHGVDRADRAAHVAGVGDKIERRDLVRDGDIAPAPIRVVGSIAAK